MSGTDVHLMAHLMRRAGFGATRDEIESAIADGYERTVDALLDTSGASAMPDDIIRRYHVDQSELRLVEVAVTNWLYRMMTTTSPLQEKIALFWHSLFATGERKVNNVQAMTSQVKTFRKFGLGSFRTLLLEISRDPAMLHWLDNHDNHRDAVNENYGRELLELFSMGIGNYSEQDVKEAARAFTGWTFENTEYMALRAMRASIWPYSRVALQFEFRSDDHDYSDKTFLGESGPFNGADIIDVIVRHPSTARFVCTRLYQFFVADEVDEAGEALIERLTQTYFDSGYEIGAILRDMFNADHFKSNSVPVPQGEESSRAGRWHAAHRPAIPTADCRDVPGWPLDQLHGSGAAEPTQRRGLARGGRVDRQRIARREGQLRLPVPGRSRDHPASGP